MFKLPWPMLATAVNIITLKTTINIEFLHNLNNFAVSVVAKSSRE